MVVSKDSHAHWLMTKSDKGCKNEMAMFEPETVFKGNILNLIPIEIVA